MTSENSKIAMGHGYKKLTNLIVIQIYYILKI